MCFSCNPWHKPITYFKGACNQFGFGLTLKRKYQLSISDNSDGSSTSVFNSKIFQKWLKTPFLGISTAFFWKPDENLVMERFEFDAQNAFGHTWSHPICKTHAGLCSTYISTITSHFRRYLDEYWFSDVREAKQRSVNVHISLAYWL